MLSVIGIVAVLYLLLRFLFKPDQDRRHMDDSDKIDEETMDFIMMDDLRRHWEERHHDGQ
jgi:hypothetical protein